MAKNSTSTMRRVVLIANIVLLIGLAGSTGYLFMKNRDLNDQITLTTEEKNRRLVEEINKVFDLPEEDPVVAIVTNKDEFIKEYATFDNAEVGDYLLFYRKARLNVLYRQSEKRVVKTATVTVPITVEIVGSDAAIKSIETKLADFGDQLSIVKTKKDDVTQSFVFDVDDDQKEESSSIASKLGFETGATLPSSTTLNDQTEVVIFAANSASSSAPAAEPATEQVP